MSSHSSHHSQKGLLPQFSLYVHKCSIKPNSFIHSLEYGLYIETLHKRRMSILLRLAKCKYKAETTRPVYTEMEK